MQHPNKMKVIYSYIYTHYKQQYLYIYVWFYVCVTTSSIKSCPMGIVICHGREQNDMVSTNNKFLILMFWINIKQKEYYLEMNINLMSPFFPSINSSNT